MNLHIRVFPEGPWWYAQGLEIDYIAQGVSFDDVVDRFVSGLAKTLELAMDDLPGAGLAANAEFEYCPAEQRWVIVSDSCGKFSIAPAPPLHEIDPMRWPPGESFEPHERLSELAAAFALDERDKIEKLLKDISSDDLKQMRGKVRYNRLARAIDVVLTYRRILDRARELDCDSYCVFHDCDARECPEGSHYD